MTIQEYLADKKPSAVSLQDLCYYPQGKEGGARESVCARERERVCERERERESDREREHECERERAWRGDHLQLFQDTPARRRDTRVKKERGSEGQEQRVPGNNPRGGVSNANFQRIVSTCARNVHKMAQRRISFSHVLRRTPFSHVFKKKENKPQPPTPRP